MAWIRGAVCTENTVESIKKQTLKLFDKIFCVNNLIENNIEAIFFSVTKDIDVCYPAKFIREKYPQFKNVAFMCMQEMDVVGALKKCIRICVGVANKNQTDVTHCYLDGAESLRPDLQ